MTPEELTRAYQDKIVNYMRDRPERFTDPSTQAEVGDKPANSWRPGRGIPVQGRQPASVQVAPGVRLQWHSVVPGLYHTLLRITPTNQEAYAQDPRFQNIDDQGRRYATVGAGPSPWDLVSATNRENDVQPHEPGVGIEPPSGWSEDAFINMMLKADREYSDDLNYDLFPHPPVPYRGMGATYNSNSYVSGLLRSLGVSPPELPVTTPGYNLPVPARNFAR